MASIKQQLEHLKQDKKLAGIIDAVGILKGKKHEDLYLALQKSIVSQQLSVKAAATIWGRFESLFPENYPHPELVLKMDVEKMRAAGLSYQKAGYIQNIARFSKEETLDYHKLKKLNDEELITYLTRIKGVGRWTTEMVLMFTLGRENVLPVDDLGIQTAMIRLYNIKADKKQLKAKMFRHAQKWEPYRTLACKYLWRYKDTK
ncbi:MAG: DNA-3-methyladenine glycosylase family protein [Bacteroidia bacterium]